MKGKELEKGSEKRELPPPLGGAQQKGKLIVGPRRRHGRQRSASSSAAPRLSYRCAFDLFLSSLLHPFPSSSLSHFSLLSSSANKRPSRKAPLPPPTFLRYFFSELTSGFFDDGGEELLMEKEEEIANFLSVPLELERVRRLHVVLFLLTPDSFCYLDFSFVSTPFFFSLHFFH